MVSFQSAVRKYGAVIVHHVLLFISEIYVRYHRQELAKHFPVDLFLIYLSWMKILLMQWLVDSFVNRIQPPYKMYVHYVYVFFVLTYLFFMAYNIIIEKTTRLALIPVVYYIILILYVSIINMKSWKNSLANDFSFLNNVIGTGVNVAADNPRHVQRVYMSHHELYILVSTWFISLIVFKTLFS